MASAPFTIVGQIAFSSLYDLADVRIYLRNLYGEELEVQYDPDFVTNGLFTVNAGNMDHVPVFQEYLTIFATNITGYSDAGYQITYNFEVDVSPQFVQPLTLQPYNLVGPTINSLYFLEGAYAHNYDNHLMIDVDGASSMQFSGSDIIAPTDRLLFNDRIVITLSALNGSKTVYCRFYDNVNNYTDGQVSIILDTVKPFVSSVTAVDHQIVEVVFSEVVRDVDANNKFNFKITGMTITSASLQPDNRTVLLTTADRMFGIRYYMEVAHIRDLAGNIMDTAVISFEGAPYPGFVWTDDLVADQTYIKAIHLQELRSNAAIKGVTPPDSDWTDPAVAVDDNVYYEHWNELRTRIGLLYSQRYGQTLSWVSGPLVAGHTDLSARHVKELRAVVDAL